MKQKICLIFILFFSSFVFSNSQNKRNLSQVRSSKKNNRYKIQKYNLSPPISIDENRDMTEALKHLKRRYDRNYTFKHSVGQSSERDDFGYAPLRSR